MAYSINGKVYTEHPLMDEIVYNTKLIINGIIIKDEQSANEKETEKSLELSNYFLAVKNNNVLFEYFPFTKDMLVGYGFSESDAKGYVNNNEQLITDLKSEAETEISADSTYSGLDKTSVTYLDAVAALFVKKKTAILDYCKTWYINHYYEYNDYYRMLNGKPEFFDQDTLKSSDFEDYTLIKKSVSELKNYISDVELSALGANLNNADSFISISPYWIYLDMSKYGSQITELSETDNYSKPLHYMSNDQINNLDALGILDDIKSTYTGSHYKYLNFLGSKSIDIYTARTTKDFGILYMPSTNLNVKDRFTELYEINREIYYRKLYQIAYSYSSDYYDEIIIIMILCETVADMIVDVPEWYIKRDIFDLRSVQYFLEANGIKFFKDIPIKYQIRIVKNMNTLIRYKSTTKNINDILDIFAVDGVYIYKYYLYKKLSQVNANSSTATKNIIATTWKMEDEAPYDFFDEEDEATIYIEDDTTTKYNFLDIADEPELIGDIEEHLFDFIDENASDVNSSTTTDTTNDNNASTEVVTDAYGNSYELEFIKVPIDDTYDHYIKNDDYKVDYDTLTLSDEYWDGDNTHNYIKNKILARDFTIEGTKYLSLNYEISAREYANQMYYFLGLIFNTSINSDDVRIALPSISSASDFSLLNVFVLLYCLSALYDGKSDTITLPSTGSAKTAIPDFTAYDEYDGGRPWDGTGTVDPGSDEPSSDKVWTMENEYDYGDEETDTFEDEATILLNSPEEYDDYNDFGYNYTPGANDEVHLYEFGDYDTLALSRLQAAKQQIRLEKQLALAKKNNPENNIEDVQDSEDIKLSADNASTETTNTYYWSNYPKTVYIENLNGGRPCVGKSKYYCNYNLNFLKRDDIISFVHNAQNVGLCEKNERGVLDSDEQYSDVQKLNDRRDIDGGVVQFTKLNHQSFYDWLKWDNSNLFINTTNFIYGFNLNADLTTIAANIGIKHSQFGFTKGYTLADLGVDTFTTTKTISSIEDLVKIYNTNIACYKNLTELMTDPESEDEMVVYEYVFNSLFIRKYDYNLYKSSNGVDYYTKFGDMLKERSAILYKYYNDLASIADKDYRKELVRDALNNISSELSYYLQGDDLKYALAFIPTISLNAITKYISLMIEFFKSWKTYFLDPVVLYVIDDKVENDAIKADKMSETKITYSYEDEISNYRDRVLIKPIYNPCELDSAGVDKVTIIYYDKVPYQTEGGTYRTEDEGEYNKTKEIDGGSVADSTDRTEDFDGGWNSCMFNNHYFAIDTKIDEAQIISQNVRLSEEVGNALISDSITEDGLYLNKSKLLANSYTGQINQLANYKAIFEDDIRQLGQIKNSSTAITETIKTDIDLHISKAWAAHEDLKNGTTLQYIQEYSANAAESLRKWYADNDPFAWQNM